MEEEELAKKTKKVQPQKSKITEESFKGLLNPIHMLRLLIKDLLSDQ